MDFQIHAYRTDTSLAMDDDNDDDNDSKSTMLLKSWLKVWISLVYFKNG